MKVEFLEDVADVGLDGVGADPESFADAAVGEAFGHEREHFAFAVGEFVERVGVASAVEQRTISSGSTTSSPAAMRWMAAMSSWR